MVGVEEDETTNANFYRSSSTGCLHRGSPFGIFLGMCLLVSEMTTRWNDLAEDWTSWSHFAPDGKRRLCSSAFLQTRRSKEDLSTSFPWVGAEIRVRSTIEHSSSITDLVASSAGFNLPCTKRHSSGSVSV
jgi:hypothetical protein